MASLGFGPGGGGPFNFDYNLAQNDPEKPPLPYREGLRFQITQHIPPPPFGPEYVNDGQGRLVVPWDERQGFRTPARFCLHNSFRTTPPHPDKSTRTLQVVEEIATGDRRGSQVVCCRADDCPDELLVAKIYDPLYYDYLDTDPVFEAEFHYSREAAAYKRLHMVGADGIHVPEYYGSWTFRMPFNGLALQSKTREVRMILIEYIPGTSISSLLNNGVFTQHKEGRGAKQKVRHLLVTQCRIDGIEKHLQLDLKARLHVLRRAAELYTLLLVIGVNQADLAYRNMLVTAVPDSGDPEIILTDLSHAFLLGTQRSTRPMLSEWPSPGRTAMFQDPNWDWVPEFDKSDEKYKAWVRTCWPEGTDSDGIA
ncbi:hypothetical protein VTK73DRAFT_9801 [Phialemonium thermophilum]|uniref:Protein kinase domain-containing protein n=1 Tax=Phialemonium thermophilum TaxID=223376 RepID=A0ABR3W0F5_9PEZI